MEIIQQYNPLRWPPDLQLAKVHMKCVCPGKDNAEGVECPCCGRFEKIKTKKWFSRNLMKDFKNYGGGVPGYFQLLKYCGVSLAILALIVIIYHIYVLETVCPLIEQQYKQNKQLLLQNECQKFLVVFKLCDAKIIFKQLTKHGYYATAFVFFYLQMFSFVYLIVATIGMKTWLQRVNNRKIIKQEKVYSYFSLMLKNIPKFYQIQNVKLQLEELVPGVDISEIFFVYQIADLQTTYKRLFDLHFQIEHVKDSIAAERGDTMQKLHALIKEYQELYLQLNTLKKNIGMNNGRAVVVFNSTEHRNAVYKKLKMDECSKFCFHTLKMFGFNSHNVHFFADKLCEPQEVIWKYIGQSSVTKTIVRVKTTAIGFGFLIIAFLLLYFPIIKIDQMNILNHSIITTLLSIFISIILQILSIVYRQIILRILPSRHPSSRQSESYFIVITTVVFHFFFYIIAPGTYFELTKKIPVNIKLKQLFVAVLMFLLMTIIVAFIDLRYRLFNNRRKKIMGAWNQWGKYCQMRLHQEIRWPSFPIEFKIMVILNIWSFNAFYIFQIPYLLFLFVIVIIVIYWVDKKNIYRHYKMQVFQSIELEISVQKDYIIMFLVCVSCGYALCAQDMWQYFFIGGMFILSLIANWLLSYRTKQAEKKLQRSMTLAQVVLAHNQNPKQSMIDTLKTFELKQTLLLLQNASTVSLGSVTFQYGYKEIYDNYLNQFKNKHVNNLLEKTYNQYVRPDYKPEAEVENIRRTTYFEKFKNNIPYQEVELQESVRSSKAVDNSVVEMGKQEDVSVSESKSESQKQQEQQK